MTGTFGSLFAGVGGFDIAFERAGFTPAWQVENDLACQKVLARHWPTTPRFSDVKEVSGRELGQVEVIVGGFPCQDISVAGRRAGLDGARSGLWWEYHRLLEELRPQWCVIENVPHLLHANRGRDMGAILGALGDLGYGFAYRVLDAQGFGAPQQRRRLFIVGCARGAADAASVLLEPESDAGSAQEAGSTHNRGQSTREPTDGPLAVYENDRHELRVSPIAYTLTTGGGKPGQGYPCWLVDGELRKATPVEMERLQGFPDNWTEGFSNNVRQRLVGNAVAVPVVEWIARRMAMVASRNVEAVA